MFDTFTKPIKKVLKEVIFGKKEEKQIHQIQSENVQLANKLKEYASKLHKLSNDLNSTKTDEELITENQKIINELNELIVRSAKLFKSTTYGEHDFIKLFKSLKGYRVGTTLDMLSKDDRIKKAIIDDSLKIHHLYLTARKDYQDKFAAYLKHRKKEAVWTDGGKYHYIEQSDMYPHLQNTLEIISGLLQEDFNLVIVDEKILKELENRVAI